MRRNRLNERFVVCIRNDDYVASLELRKIYRTMPDAAAAKHNYIRIVDESGEDYLFPAEFFFPIELSKAVQRAISAAS